MRVTRRDLRSECEIGEWLQSSSEIRWHPLTGREGNVLTAKGAFFIRSLYPLMLTSS